MKREKEFYTKSKRMQTFLELRGVMPIREYHETAVYKLDDRLRDLIDSYHVAYDVFKGVF